MAAAGVAVDEGHPEAVGTAVAWTRWARLETAEEGVETRGAVREGQGVEAMQLLQLRPESL